MEFLSNDFLLSSPAARELYRTVKDLPILDYHCHLSPKEIYQNRTYNSLGELWLGGDHYKWRVMRAAGIPERLVTGNAPYDEKLRAWAEVVPTLAGNPLYHFSHLELKNYFGITTPLAPDTVDAIEQEVNEQLKTLRARDFIVKAGVKGLITTDSPLDSLEYHTLLKRDFEVPVLPAFRPDEFLYIERPAFAAAITKLGQIAEGTVTNYETLKTALIRRLDFFVAQDTVAADHGLDYVPYHPNHAALAPVAMEKRLAGEPLSQEEIDAFKCDLLCVLAAEYTQRNIVCELHFGCYRNGNPLLFSQLGADIGVDGIRGETRAENLYPLLGEWASAGTLPRTLLFSLNPADDALLNTVAAAFQKEGERGWVQQGSAWWFNDHLYGMRAQLKAYASTLPLATFAGMLTDSRSLLSYARHEYFRRILCDYLGSLITEGQYPAARIDDLAKTAQAIAYTNTRDYFRFR